MQLDEIYDAAFDRDLMPGLLARLLASLGAQQGFLGWTNVAEHTRFEVQHGHDPAFLKSYVEHYWEYDSMRPQLYEAAEGEISQAFAAMQHPEVRESIFYREWLEPQGIIDNLAVNIFKRPELIATLAIIRTAPARPFSEDERAVLQGLLPHLKRAIFIQSRLINHANVVSAYQQVVGSARHSVVLLNDMRLIVHMTVPPGSFPGLAVGHRLPSSEIGQAMVAAVETELPQTASAAIGGVDHMFLCTAQHIERDSFADMAAGFGIAHAVHITAIDQSLTMALDALSRLYHLTPTESRVLTDALHHADLTQAGTRLGMGRATVRTHLHRIYDKTGTTSLTALALHAHRFVIPYG